MCTVVEVRPNVAFVALDKVRTIVSSAKFSAIASSVMAIDKVAVDKPAGMVTVPVEARV